MRVSGYVRVSGLSQIAGDGFRRQDDAIANWCRANDHVYDRCYPEYGVTGDNDTSGRVALTYVLDRIRNDPGHSRLIVAEDHTRMARGTMAGLVILEDVLKAGATVYCASSNMVWSVDRTNGEGKFIWTILQAAADFEKTKQLNRCNAAKAAKRAEGIKVDGRMKYGERPRKIKSEKVMDRVNTELAIIEFVERNASDGPSKLARRLNESCLFKRKGTKWTQPEMSRLMKRLRRQRGIQTDLKTGPKKQQKEAA